MKSSREFKNLFELWSQNGEKLPFEAKRLAWDKSIYVIITYLEIRNWPFGKAYGYMQGADRKGAEIEIPMANAYQWELVELKS